MPGLEPLGVLRPELTHTSHNEDSHANVYPRPGALAGMRLAETGHESSPLAAGIYDLPLGMVSRQLYLDE